MDILPVEKPSYMTEDLDIFREAVGKFLERECQPHVEQWLNDGAVKVFVHVHDKNFPPAPLNIKPRLLVGSNIVGNGIPLSGIRILNDYIRFDVLPLFEGFFSESKENVK